MLVPSTSIPNVFVLTQLFLLQAYDTGLPVWGLLLAALVVAVYIIPGGYIYALSAQAVSMHHIVDISLKLSNAAAHGEHRCRDHSELLVPRGAHC